MEGGQLAADAQGGDGVVATDRFIGDDDQLIEAAAGGFGERPDGLDRIPDRVTLCQRRPLPATPITKRLDASSIHL